MLGGAQTDLFSILGRLFLRIIMKFSIAHYQTLIIIMRIMMMVIIAYDDDDNDHHHHSMPHLSSFLDHYEVSISLV